MYKYDIYAANFCFLGHMLCVWHFGASDQWASVLSKLAKVVPVAWKRHPPKVIPRQNICSQFLIMILGQKWVNDIKQQTPRKLVWDRTDQSFPPG